jgi:general secretion pathway protein A
MYEAHFGLSGPPFQLNPDPSFYFNSKGHGHALAYLRYGVVQGEGFIVVTGDIGAGKTTLVRTLLDELDRAHVIAAQIVSTQLESGDLLQAIIQAFGIPSQGSTKASMISTLEAFLMTLATQGRRALLVIDEAQNLEIRAIEELRMLSNFQLGTQTLLQSFLVGQPELRKALESPSMEQLRQRVTASCHLGPLGLDETRGYVEHRLGRVGWKQRPFISDGAFDQIYRWTGGVPRRINRLANRLLLAAFLEGREDISGELVEQTAHELQHEIGEAGFEPVPLPARAAAPVSASEVPAPGLGSVSPAVALAEAAESPVEMTETPVAELALFEAPAVLAPPAVAKPVPAEPPVPTPVTRVVVPVAEALSTPVEPTSVVPEAVAVAASEVPLVPVSELPAEVDLRSASSSVLSQPAAQTIEVLREQAGLEASPILLGLVDSTGAALKLASVAKALSALPSAPKVVLFNPGRGTDLWPWEDMQSLLPAFPAEVHMGLRAGVFEAGASVLAAGLDHVLARYAPLAVLSLGDSDAMLAATLMAKKRGLPVVRLDAGARDSALKDEALNANLIEQAADLLFAAAQPAKMQRLYREGIVSDRVHAVPATLATDVLNAAMPLMTTPYGAFLRHRLPIFLGPRWSSEVEGTAYAVVALRLDPEMPQRTAALLDVLVDLQSLPKLVWLTDEDSRKAICQWQANTPARAADVFLVHEGMAREELDRRNSARILCSDIRSLPDYFSVLRGATGLLCEPGHVLADGARLLGVPTLLLDGSRLVVHRLVDGSTLQRPWGSVALNEALADWLAQGEPPAPAATLASTAVEAAPVVARRLQAWLAQDNVSRVGTQSKVDPVAESQAVPVMDLAS